MEIIGKEEKYRASARLAGLSKAGGEKAETP